MDSSGPRRLGNHAVLFAWRDSTPHWSLQWSFSVWLCRFLNPKNKLKHQFLLCMSYFDPIFHAWLEPQIFQSRCPIILTCPYGRPICSQLKRAVALLLFPSPFILASSWLFSIRVKRVLQIIGPIGTWWDMPQTLQSNVAATQNYAIWSIKQKRPCGLHLSQLLLSFVHFVQACGDNGCIPVGTKIAETSDPSSSASLCFT